MKVREIDYDRCSKPMQRLYSEEEGRRTERRAERACKERTYTRSCGKGSVLSYRSRRDCGIHRPKWRRKEYHDQNDVRDSYSD